MAPTNELTRTTQNSEFYYKLKIGNLWEEDEIRKLLTKLMDYNKYSFGYLELEIIELQ